MTQAANFGGDVNVTGTLTTKNFTPPAASVGDQAITGGSGAYVQAQKLGQQFQKEYSQPAASSAAVEQKVVHVVRGATAVIQDVAFGASTAAIGAATAVFDVLKNGTTVLSAQVTLDSTTGAYVLKAGTLSVTSCVVGDVLEIKVVSATAGGGTLAKGLFARLTVREDPQ